MFYSSFLVLFVIFAFSFEKGDLFKLPKVSNKTDDDVNLQIVNGYFAKHGQFPYQVSIFSETKPNWGIFCGGVIMSDEWIVTASHCIIDEKTGRHYDPQIVNVRVGIDSLYDDPNIQKNTHRVSEVIPNPNYVVGRFDNDVALLRLSDKIQMTDDVKAACFDFSERQYSYLIVSGYGKTGKPIRDLDGNEIDGGVQGNELKFAYMKEKRDADFCAGMTRVCIVPYYNDGSSSCNGDSGGPLSSPDYQVIGVFSTIHGVRNGDHIDMCVGNSQYTRLSRFVNFIDQHVPKDSYCH